MTYRDRGCKVTRRLRLHCRSVSSSEAFWMPAMTSSSARRAGRRRRRLVVLHRRPREAIPPPGRLRGGHAEAGPHPRRGCARRPGGDAAGVPRPGGPESKEPPLHRHRTKGRRPSRRAVLSESRALARFSGWPVLAGAASLLRPVLRRSGHVWTLASVDPLLLTLFDHRRPKFAAMRNALPCGTSVTGISRIPSFVRHDEP
jgi:hypothetical protein